VDLNALLDATLRVASLRYRGRIETLYTAVPMVSASSQELKQVFLNLLLNAAHAIDENGLIRVATLQVGGDVVVTIQDDGCGMTPELLERIFDPFFTSKAVGEGTGLGLAICHQIVRRHGGDIQVESEPGRGTIMRVRLPIRRDEGDPS
jgi:signal transduction histidine kinase